MSPFCFKTGMHTYSDQRYNRTLFATFYVMLLTIHFVSYTHRVDGLLFINLSEDEWPDMGIVNRFHIRKLQLILKSYRVRYQRRKDKIQVDEDDDLLSEISPSELSGLLAAEDNMDDDYSSDDSSEVSFICVFVGVFGWCLCYDVAASCSDVYAQPCLLVFVCTGESLAVQVSPHTV